MQKQKRFKQNLKKIQKLKTLKYLRVTYEFKYNVGERFSIEFKIYSTLLKNYSVNFIVIYF